MLLVNLLFPLLVWLVISFTARSGAQRLKFALVTGCGLGVWFALVALLGNIGFFSFNPLVAPNIVLGFIVLFVLLKKVYSSPWVWRVVETIPLPWIIVVQINRLLGLSFFNLYEQGVLPAVFAFPSGFGDIFVGATAPVVAFLYAKKLPYSRHLAIAWNLIGIADLIMALGIGILGFPRPFQVLPITPTTLPLSLYPLVLIPLFAVPLSLLLHFFSLRIIKLHPANSIHSFNTRIIKKGLEK